MLKKLLMRIGLLVGLTIALVLVAILTQSIIATQKLKSVLMQLEKDSIPVSWAEFCNRIPNWEAHLAAQSQLFSALDDLANLPDLSDEEKEMLPIEGYAELPEIGDNLPPAMISALENRLREAEPALDILSQVIAKEPFWLVPPSKTFYSPTMSRLSTVRQAAQLFNMSAILYSERDDTVAAIQSVIDGVRLSAVLHRGASLIDELVRFYYEEFAIRSLERVLAGTDPSDESLQKLDSMLAEHSDMRTGILGEIVYTKQFYEGMSDLSWSEIKTMIEFSRPRPHQHLIAYLPVSSGWIRMNKAYHLELLHHVATTWHLPWQDFTNRYVEASDSIPWLYFLPNLKTSPYSLFNIWEYMYSSAKKREVRARGTWRCGRIAVAIERYSREHGEIPHSLLVLIPKYLDDLPTEPFQGEPFGYVSDGETGVLKFEYPDIEYPYSDKDFTFKVFASKESKNIELEQVGAD